MANTHDDELAPIDYFAVEFPDGVVSGSGFQRLVDMVDLGIVRLLDVEFIEKGPDGRPRPLSVEDMATGEGVDLAVLAGASSGLLDPDDIAELTNDIAPGAVAAVVVYENLWVFTLIDGWRSAGARLIADGGLSAGDLIDALDATEPA
jgi:hypothetical protein